MTNKAKKSIEITDYNLEDHRLETEYGYVTWIEWLRLEKKRIGNCRIISRKTSHGTQFALVKTKKGGKLPMKG